MCEKYRRHYHPAITLSQRHINFLKLNVPLSLHSTLCFYQLYLAQREAADGLFLTRVISASPQSSVWGVPWKPKCSQLLWSCPWCCTRPVKGTCESAPFSLPHRQWCPANSAHKPLQFRLHCSCTSYFSECISGDLMPLLALACRPFAVTNPKVVEMA